LRSFRTADPGSTNHSTRPVLPPEQQLFELFIQPVALPLAQPVPLRPCRFALVASIVPSRFLGWAHFTSVVL
jgi:hypothetical protein